MKNFFKMLGLGSVFGVAFADAAPVAAAKGGFDIMQIAPIFLVLIVFYFLLIRPQQKKMKQHQDLVSQVKRGDKVMTSSGIIAEVDRLVNDQEVLLEIAPNVRVRFAKQMITEVLSKTTELASKKETAKEVETDVAPANKIAAKKPAKAAVTRTTAKKAK